MNEGWAIVIGLCVGTLLSVGGSFAFMEDVGRGPRIAGWALIGAGLAFLVPAIVRLWIMTVLA